VLSFDRAFDDDAKTPHLFLMRELLVHVRESRKIVLVIVVRIQQLGPKRC
jgi:hypothetical protein